MRILAKKTAVLVVGFAIALSACGDDSGTGPNGSDLSASEQQALINALNSSGALAATPFAGLAAVVIGTLGQVGSIGSIQSGQLDGISVAPQAALAESYEQAVGVQIGYEDNTNGIEFWFIAVIGWNGLDAGAGTVDEIVVVGGFDDETGSTPPETASGTIGVDPYTFGVFWNSTDTFNGTSGAASMTGSNFSGSTDCSASAQGISVACSYSAGNMSGNFDFEAIGLQTQGGYSQVPVNFSGLPSVRIIMSVST